MKVKIDSIWVGSSFEEFQVDAVEYKDNGTWVFYHRVSNPSSAYSCLVDAFLQRFSLTENSK